MVLITAYSFGVLATTAAAILLWLGHFAWKRSKALVSTLHDPGGRRKV